MKIEWFKDHINEELEGAKEYITYANEHKNSHPYWASRFLKLACDEMNHADCLMKMLDKYNAEVPSRSEQYDAMYKTIMEDYATAVPQFNSMKQAFYQ